MNIFNSARLRERKEGLDVLQELFKDKSKCLIIHYSCESFITNHGKTPRVTSICVRNLKTAQTTCFSIHLQAQIKGYSITSLNHAQYDSLEKDMLSDFTKFVSKHGAYKWIHWNMRDSNYGFEAINNRIKILKGKAFEIDDDFKYDFPRILGAIFTFGYEANQPKGRLLNLAVRNNLTIKDALTGQEEADAFDNQHYLALHISTLRKVDLIDGILHRIQFNEIKVKVDKKKIYGLSLAGIWEIVRETPWLLLIVSILGYIVGAALEPIVQSATHTAP